MEGDVGVDYVRMPSSDVDCLLFMIDEARSVVSALDERYRAIEAAVVAEILDTPQRVKRARAARLGEEEALDRLISAHRVATVAWEAALRDIDKADPSAEAMAIERDRKARWDAASAALLNWRPVTFAGNADRIRYLTNEDHGHWRGVGPTEEELTMLFASMMEPTNG